MAAKIIAHRKTITSRKRLSYGRELYSLIEDQRALSKRLIKLLEHLEDEDDHRRIEAAKKRNAGKPGLSWEEAKKRLGLKFD